MALTNYQKFCGWNQHQFTISPFWWIRSLRKAPRVLCWVSQGQSNSRTASLLRGYVMLVPSLSHVWLFATPWTAAHQASLSSTISQGLLKLMSTEWVIPSKHCILCHPPLFLPSTFPSIRVFSNDLALHVRWPMYWSFNFSISPSNEYSELISFRIDWFDLLAVQGTLKSLLWHHNSKASIFQHSAFFLVRLSYPYMTLVWEKLWEKLWLYGALLAKRCLCFSIL